jgi:hypothetical protein
LFYRLANQPGLFTAIAIDTLDDASGLALKRHSTYM